MYPICISSVKAVRTVKCSVHWDTFDGRLAHLPLSSNNPSLTETKSDDRFSSVPATRRSCKAIKKNNGRAMSGVKMDDELPEYERCQVDPNVCGAFIIRPLARSFAFRSALMSYVFLSEISYSGFDNIIRITSPWHRCRAML